MKSYFILLLLLNFSCAHLLAMHKQKNHIPLTRSAEELEMLAGQNRLITIIQREVGERVTYLSRLPIISPSLSRERQLFMEDMMRHHKRTVLYLSPANLRHSQEVCGKSKQEFINSWPQIQEGIDQKMADFEKKVQSNTAQADTENFDLP